MEKTMVKLSAQPMVNYSDAERELFNLLPVGSKSAITSLDIADKKHNGAPAPFHALANVRATLSSLIRKTEANKEPFRIKKSRRSGPHPMKIWIEHKKGKR